MANPRRIYIPDEYLDRVEEPFDACKLDDRIETLGDLAPPHAENGALK